MDTVTGGTSKVIELVEKRKEAERLVNRFVMGCAGTAALTGPVPGTSIILTGIETTMVYQVAKAYGLTLTLQEAGISVTALIAVSTGVKVLAIEASTFLPLLGWWLIKPAIAAAVCKAVGTIAISHFEKKLEQRQGAWSSTPPL